MTHSKRLPPYIVSLALLLWPGAASAEAVNELFSKDTPVEITADRISYDKAAETYVASGDVVIVQEMTTLRADTVILDNAAGVATAAGRVEILDEGGNMLRGEDLRFDIAARTAVIARGRIFYNEENITILGDPIKKTGPESYEARKVTFTTCDCEEDRSPAWSFYATSAQVTVGEFLTGRNAFFYIKGVPVLYSPYVSIPIKRERQSGFLQPRPGYSELRGFVLGNSYYWAISRNTDATFFLDIETSRGTGSGAEYRYIRTRNSYGEALFYYFDEKDLDRVRQFRSGVDNLSRPQSARSGRWRLNLVHAEQFDSNVSFKADINLVSDDEYYIDFGRSLKERSLESVESNISVSRNWSGYSLVAQFRHFNNLLKEDESDTLQKLPEVIFTGTNRRMLGTPFFLSTRSAYVNFWRRSGTDGHRVDFQPRVSLPLSPGGYFELTPSVTPRATFYRVDEQPGGPFFDRYLYEARVDLTTTFLRVYRPELETLRALRHTIRPKLTYTYVPEAVQSDLPKFDSVDTVAASSSLAYSLNSILTGRLDEDRTTRYIDYLYIDLGQSYNFIEASRRLDSETQKKRPFSDIDAEMIIRPGQLSTLSAKAKYDVYNHLFTSYNASVSLADRRGDSLYLSYRFVRAADGTTETSYLEGRLRAHLTAAVDATYLKRFSFDEYRSLETAYGLEYRHKCWSSELTYTEKLEEKVVFLTFNLRGIGKVAGVEGKIER